MAGLLDKLIELAEKALDTLIKAATGDIAAKDPIATIRYATIPKAKCGQPLDRTVYRYLDAVHMDIAFGDCVSVGGYRFALILVDRATRYNWAFGLKTLSSSCILSAL
jgi:hypothetical protein